MISDKIEVKDLFSYIREKMQFDQSKIGGNFIVTDDANKRLEKVDHLMKSKIPIMLLGPTGTSKTKTILVWCDLKKQQFKENGSKSDDLPGEIIRFNPSAETTIDDLFGRLISDSDHLADSNLKWDHILLLSQKVMYSCWMSVIYVHYSFLRVLNHL